MFFLGCFPSAGHLRATLFFGAKPLLLSCASLRVPCYPFGLNMHFLAFFSGLGACNLLKHDDWDWSDPWALLSVLSPPSFGEPPTAARQRVFSWVASFLSSSHTWETRMWSAVAGGAGDRRRTRREGTTSVERGKRRESSARRSAGTMDLMTAELGFLLPGHPALPGNPGCGGKSRKIQILRRNGSSGRSG